MPDDAHLPAAVAAAGRTLNLGARLSAKRRDLRYTRFVGLMKVLLPVVAIVLIVLVVAWPQLQPGDERFQIGYSRINPEAAEKLSMVNARYTGVDSHDRPFTLTAESVTKLGGSSDLVRLRSPEADMTTESGAWVALRANSGLYNQTTQRLKLTGSVTVFHDAGYEFRTTRAEVDLGSGTAEGDDPVEGQGPAGLIDAEGFRILDGGDHVVFTGESHLTVFPGSEEPTR